LTHCQLQIVIGSPACYLSTPNGTIRPFVLSQKGIAKDAAHANILGLAEQLGYGTNDKVRAANKTSLVFHKGKFEELSDIAQDCLKKSVYLIAYILFCSMYCYYFILQSGTII